MFPPFPEATEIVIPENSEYSDAPTLPAGDERGKVRLLFFQVRFQRQCDVFCFEDVGWFGTAQKKQSERVVPNSPRVANVPTKQNEIPAIKSHIQTTKQRLQELSSLIEQERSNANSPERVQQLAKLVQQESMQIRNTEHAVERVLPEAIRNVSPFPHQKNTNTVIEGYQYARSLVNAPPLRPQEEVPFAQPPMRPHTIHEIGVPQRSPIPVEKALSPPAPRSPIPVPKSASPPTITDAPFHVQHNFTRFRY